MDDSELLRQALEALKEPALNTHDLQSRIAARLAEIYSGHVEAVPQSQAEHPLESSIPILPGQRDPTG